MNDLNDWKRELDKQILYEKQNNEANFKACKHCGDKGFYLSADYDNNMYYLCCNYCSCNIGNALRMKHITKREKE